jgi:hypothetical protein
MRTILIDFVDGLVDVYRYQPSITYTGFGCPSGSGWQSFPSSSEIGCTGHTGSYTWKIDIPRRILPVRCRMNDVHDLFRRFRTIITSRSGKHRVGRGRHQ